jgi:large subunit ribosomal protein L21
MKFAVIQTGGKQYVVKKDDEIVVDNLNLEPDADIEFDTLAEGDDEKHDISLGTPLLKSRVKGKVLENLKGDKIRVARFKSKVRSRKVRGFRASLSKVKIISL